MPGDQALGIANAAIFALDSDGNFRLIRQEQSAGDRKAMKVVPVPGSVISERYSAAQVKLYSETASANAQSVTNPAYATKVSKQVYYEGIIGYGATVEIIVRCNVSYAGVLRIRILDENDDIIGAEQTTTQAPGSYDTLTFSWAEIENSVGDTLKIQARVDGTNTIGIMYVESIKVKNPYARPAVTANGSSTGAALTTTLDTMGFPFVSYIIQGNTAGVVDFEVSLDNVTWYLHTRRTLSTAEVFPRDLTCGFRYVRLKSTSTINWAFLLSAKR